jgi:hypothetical protein
MTLVLTRQIENLSNINLDYLQKYYPNDVKQDAKIFFIVSRVFNDVLKEIDVSFDVPYERNVIYKTYAYQLNLQDIVEQHHIAKDYHFEIIIRYINNNGKIKMVFPGEIRYSGNEKIPSISETAVPELITLFEPHEIATKLAGCNFPDISKDLIQSIRRFNSGDFEGSIQFSRKVVEGIRQLIIEEIINESNRQEKFKNYLNSSFSLLSNFGEHTGTSASEEEALLAKEIAFGLARYLVSKVEV